MESPANAKKSGGKGLGWNDDELLALAHAAPKVCLDPCTGKQMTRKEMGERLRKVMIESTIRPSDACKFVQSKDHRDTRRWEGRSAEACYRKWTAMRAACTTMYGITKRIESLNLTGNFGKQDKFRMAMVEFSCGAQVTGHLYDIGNNKDYMYTNKFEFSVAYDFLVGNTSLITGSAFQTNKDVHEGLKERPVGTKEAKRRKEEARKVSKSDGVVEKTVQRSAHDISVSIAKTNDIIEARQANKLQLAREQLKFEREKWLMNQASALFGAGSAASEEEKDMAARLMRKRTMSSLVEMFAENATETENKFVLKGRLSELTSNMNDESPSHNDEEKEEENEDWKNVETQPPPETQHETQEDEILCSPFECDEEELEE